MAKKSVQVSFFNNVGFVEKLIFTKHLAVMIKSGIVIADAIEIIRDQTQNPAFKKVLSEILKDIDNGQSLEKALSRHPKIFDPLFTNLIRVGEESGTLEDNLVYLADQLRKSYEFKKKIIGALLYPAIVLTAALVVGIGISLFVFPQLIELFKSLDVELPITTQILLITATITRDYGVFILIGLIIFIILLRLITRLPSVKGKWHAFLLSLPVIGIFIQNIHLATMCRNLGIMLKSGMPITSALQTEAQATTNLVYKRYLLQLLKGLEKGKSVAEELKSAKFKFMPIMVIKMVEVGEKAGNLDENLVYLGNFFEDDVDNYSRNFATIIEPIVLLMIGLLVAFVALAVISPIYQLTGSIKR